MKTPNLSGDIQNADGQKTPSAGWEMAAWLLSVSAFVTAAVLSYRQIHYHIPNDLRSPGLLVVDAFLASAVALGFAMNQGSLTRWTDARFCLQFGLWAAAIFRFVPPVINEDVLYFKNFGTFDAPYVVLGAVIHGGVAALLACPFALRVLHLPSWSDDQKYWEMSGAAVLIFFIVACGVRLLAEKWWL